MTKKRTTQKQKNEAKLNALYLAIMENPQSNEEQKREANKTVFLYNASRLTYEEVLIRLTLALADKVNTIYEAKTLEALSQLETITETNN